jgi:hypothetical protein
MPAHKVFAKKKAVSSAILRSRKSTSPEMKPLKVLNRTAKVRKYSQADSG